MKRGKMMKVVAIEECGVAEMFKCREEPFPIPKHDEVVIQVLATCVNKMDLWRTDTEYELPPDSNPVPGLECAGTIIEVGEDVHEWKVNEQVIAWCRQEPSNTYSTNSEGKMSWSEVCALLNGGGYAEAVVVRATQVLPLPLDKSFVYPLPLDESFIYQVAGLPHAACIAWEAISRLGKLSANMTLLVYERCGKICDLAVQLAEMVQANVIVARDESTFIKNFSHPTVDVKSPHFVVDVLEATGDKKGVDIILDCDVYTLEELARPLREDWDVSKPVNLATPLRVGGTIVLVDLGPEKVTIVDLFCMYYTNAVLHVVDSMRWTPDYMAAVVLDMKKNMWPAFSNGTLVLPEVGKQKSYWLSDAFLAQSGDILTPLSLSSKTHNINRVNQVLQSPIISSSPPSISLIVVGA